MEGKVGMEGTCCVLLQIDSPFRLLIVAFPSIADWLRSKLDQTIVQLAMRPVELWI
jgi:hypothetical protein